MPGVRERGGGGCKVEVTGDNGGSVLPGQPKTLTEHLPELSAPNTGAGVFVHWFSSLVGQLLISKWCSGRLEGPPPQPPWQSEDLQPLRHNVVSRRGPRAVWTVHLAWAVRGGAGWMRAGAAHVPMSLMLADRLGALVKPPPAHKSAGPPSL